MPLVSRRAAARFILIAGIIFMCFGVALLRNNLSNFSQAAVVLSFFLVFLGVGLTILAIKLNKRSVFVFFGVFFLLVCIFLVLSMLKIFPLPFSRAWPLLSVFSGVAILSAGFMRYRSIRWRYFVPSISFIALGFLLLFFSLNIITLSFAEFVKQWWPLFVLLWGLVLILVSFGFMRTGNNRQ
jgi:hypothetical protein